MARAIIASRQIHQIFRAELKAPLAEMGFTLWSGSRRPVFLRPDGGRYRTIEFSTSRRAYPDDQYGRAYECGLLTYREPLVADEDSVDSEQSPQELFDEADWAAYLRVRRHIRTDTWPAWRRVVEFGELRPLPGSLAEPAAGERPEGGVFEVSVRTRLARLPPTLARGAYRLMLVLTAGTRDSGTHDAQLLRARGLRSRAGVGRTSTATARRWIFDPVRRPGRVLQSAENEPSLRGRVDSTPRRLRG